MEDASILMECRKRVREFIKVDSNSIAQNQINARAAAIALSLDGEKV
jgi:hypothetical protein